MEEVKTHDVRGVPVNEPVFPGERTIVWGGDQSSSSQVGFKSYYTEVPCANSKPVPSEQPHSIGGGPTRASIIPADATERKKYPIATGLMDYFPDALAAVANLSYVANHQHNPGKPVHWDRAKSTDEADTMLRHFLQRGTVDSDGIRHTTKVAWRALAMLQKEIESGS